MKIVQIDENTLLPAMQAWNEVVEEGVAFPQDMPLTKETAQKFFEGQSATKVAVNDLGEVTGMYILHPNNVGRCGHICNASYAVKAKFRGQGVGQALVKDCIQTASRLGFTILQFNAVVADNAAALGLYKKLGFTRLGVIPKGFHSKNGEYKDIIPHYLSLEENH